jgi:hypothetical protein
VVFRGGPLEAGEDLMAISVVSTAERAATSSTVYVDLAATPILAGDIIITYLSEALTVYVPSAIPAGFTPICDARQGITGYNVFHQAYYKVAVGGEEGTRLSWTIASPTAYSTGAIVLRGVDAAIFDVTPTHATYHTWQENTITPTCPSVTTVTNGAFVLEISTMYHTYTSVASSNGAATQWANPKATYAPSFATYFEQAVAGLHSGSTHTYTGGDLRDESIQLTLAIRPDGGAIPGGSATLRSTLALRTGLNL